MPEEAAEARHQDTEDAVYGNLRDLLAEQKYVECVMVCNLQHDLQQPIMRQALAVAEIHLAAERFAWSKVDACTLPFSFHSVGCHLLPC